MYSSLIDQDPKFVIFLIEMTLSGNLGTRMQSTFKAVRTMIPHHQKRTRMSEIFPQSPCQKDVSVDDATFMKQRLLFDAVARRPVFLLQNLLQSCLINRSYRCS
jgi:hypothetical protein